jgi:hypothetical protein
MDYTLSSKRRQEIFNKNSTKRHNKKFSIVKFKLTQMAKKKCAARE